VANIQILVQTKVSLIRDGHAIIPNKIREIDSKIIPIGQKLSV
jgi:hypothetical protein